LPAADLPKWLILWLDIRVPVFISPLWLGFFPFSSFLQVELIVSGASFFFFPYFSIPGLHDTDFDPPHREQGLSSSSGEFTQIYKIPSQQRRDECRSRLSLTDHILPLPTPSSSPNINRFDSRREFI